MSKHKTAKGREFNMQAFTSNRGETIAVGNSGRNARGDLLGPGGKIMTTSQEIANTVYNKQASAQSKTVKINPMEQEVSRRDIVGADGVARVEVTFADGSIEIQTKKGAKAAKSVSDPLDFDFNNIDKEL
jgi:hypothetical protein